MSHSSSLFRNVLCKGGCASDAAPHGCVNYRVIVQRGGE